MLKIKDSDKKSVYSIEKITINEELFLRWGSSGFTNFIVISSTDKENVLITNDNKDVFINNIQQVSKELIAEKNANIPENNSMCYLTSLNELKRDGGLHIKNMPAFFAVYGFEKENEDFVIYCEANSYASNVFSMTVDVFINDEAFFIEKSVLFKRKKEYSGYHRISMPTPNPMLVGGVLKYKINGYSYPFPDEVVKNGGSFFVCADSNMNLHFKSNNPGIIIK